MNFRKLVKAFIPRHLFAKVEPYGHLAEAVLAQTLAGFPARGMKVIGVTGTDGKSTTSLLIAHMLKSGGRKVGLLTTIAVDYGDGAGEQPNPTRNHMTTAGVWELTKILKNMRSNGVEWLVLETSSHALSQRRVWGIPFSVAVLTNLSHEHLDYYGSMKNYQSAKLRLFKQTNSNRHGLRTGIINADDNAADVFARAIANPITYGLKSGDLQAVGVKSNSTGVNYKVKTDSEILKIKCHLIGEFNAYNSLAAVAVGRALGLTGAQIEKGIASLKQVPGRMMSVDAGQNFKVIIDYAVTPKALEQVLRSAKQIAGRGRVVLVFGATGNRDKSKRHVMGEVATKGADKIFLTDDETYTEDPGAIRQAVYNGIQAAGGTDRCEETADRKQAIQAALEEARAGDIVLITGLGHQTTRNMGGRDEAWSDEAVASDLLSKLR